MFLARRRSVTGGDGSDRPGDELTDPAVLDDRRRFLTQSLADADAEYLAGDLSDKDYLALRQRDMRRLSAVEARLATVESTGTDRSPTPSPVSSQVPSPSTVLVAEDPDPTSVEDGGPDVDDEPRRGGSRKRRSGWFLVGAVAAFGAALIVAVTLFASNRLPGQTVTGSVSLTPAQQINEQLAEAAEDENQSQLGPAAQLYQSVLAKHPDNEVALAQLGWLEYETGVQGDSTSLIKDARAKLDRAIGLNPGDYAARLYLGTILLRQDGNAAGAVAQYDDFLADHPPASVLGQAAPELRQAYQQAGVALPAGVPSA